MKIAESGFHEQGAKRIANVRYDRRISKISLAWMLCKKPFIIPIPGSRKPERLKENFGAEEIILTAEEIAAIDKKLDTMTVPVFGGQ